MKILPPILLSLIQIIGLVLIYEVINHYYPTHHRSVGFGLSIFYTMIAFIPAIITLNIYLAFFTKNIYLIGGFLLIIIGIFLLGAFEQYPLRSLFLFLLALFGFSISFILHRYKK